TLYNAVTGDGDTAGGANATGAYTLTIKSYPEQDDDTDNASSLGTITTTPTSVDSMIYPDIDADIFSFTATAGQAVDFDIDTPTGRPDKLDSYIRLFDGQGNQIATNDNGTAPGENASPRDAYLRYTFASGGKYFIGIS